VLALSVAAAVHNLEEWRGYEKWAHVFHRRLNARLNNRRVCGIALILLSAALLILGVAEFAEGPGWTTAYSKVAVFALLVNALGHCVKSVRAREVVPGTISALLLIMPLSLIAIYAMRHDHGDSGKTLALSFIAALPVLPIAVYGSLWGGFLVNGLLARIVRRRGE
jgi:hypothetical protein